MKKALVLCALVGVGVYATTALSASGPTPVEKQLQKDVATLKKQVKTLQTQVKNLNTNTGEALAELAILGVCQAELTTDALQSTWTIIDQLSAATQAGKTYFGPQSPIVVNISGRDWCSLANVTRSQVLPPTIAQYQALLAPFQGSASNSLGTSALRVLGLKAN
jgi:hypothetical protein